MFNKKKPKSSPNKVRNAPPVVSDNELIEKIEASLQRDDLTLRKRNNLKLKLKMLQDGTAQATADGSQDQAPEQD